MSNRNLSSHTVTLAAIAFVTAAGVALSACTGAATASPVSPTTTAAPSPPGSPDVTFVPTTAGQTPVPSPAASPTGTPTPTPTEPPGLGTISHPAEATAVILRYEAGGGFIRPAFLAGSVPTFTLYGDGTVLYRPANAEMPARGPGDPLRFPPLLVAKASEAQVQALLADALGSGLAVARAEYTNQMVADAPTTIFTLNANGTQKSVRIYALGLDGAAGQDGAVLAGLAHLADRLANFDQEVGAGNATAVGAFRPGRYRATLIEGDLGGQPPIAWPWMGFGPASFVVPTNDPFDPLPSRVISGLEAGQLNLANIEGGVSDIPVKAGARTFGLGLRPLLPDETH